MKTLTVLLSSLLLAGGAFAFQAQDAKQDATAKDAKVQEASADDAAVIREQLPSYPIEKCLVSDEPLTAQGEPIDFVYEGRLVRFCCKGCVKGFKKSPEKFTAQIDAAVVEAQRPSYPLETCPISGEKLGSMGDPVELVNGTRLVRLCCKGCIKSFKKDPAKVMEKVDAAYVAAQLKTYPMETCPVSGEKLGGMGDPIDYLYGTRLVRFCCEGCVKGFRKDPQGYLAKLDVAAGEKG